jgi:hypothetical protein
MFIVNSFIFSEKGKNGQEEKWKTKSEVIDLQMIHKQSYLHMHVEREKDEKEKESKEINRWRIRIRHKKNQSYW